MTWELALGYLFFFLLLGIVWGWNEEFGPRKAGRRSAHLFMLRLSKGSRSSWDTMHALSEIGATGELFSRLSQFHLPFAAEVSVHQTGDDILFSLVVPQRHRRNVLAAAKPLFPAAQGAGLHLDPWLGQADLAVGYLVQGKTPLIPLKPAVMPVFDPFLPILRRLSELQSLKEGVVIQWVIRPASKKVEREFKKELQKFKSGTAQSFKLLHQDFLITPETVTVLEEKLSAPLYAVTGRLLAASHEPGGANKILLELEEAFAKTSHGMLYNSLRVVKAKNTDQALNAFFNREMDSAAEMILNRQELTELFHFPIQKSK